MLLKIKNWLNANTEKTEDVSSHQAIALLLFEAATSDYNLDESETEALKSALQEGVDVDANEAEALFEWAKQRSMQSTSLYPFTRTINESLSFEEKIRLMVSLWKIAFADGRVDKYEEHYLRHIADLLYISHSEFIGAKLKAEQASV